jgi:predicted esterase
MANVRYRHLSEGEAMRILFLRISIVFVVCAALAAGLSLQAGQEAAAPIGPQVKMLSLPQPVLRPPVDFLAREPVIDGRLDEELRRLERRPFAALVKMNPANPDTNADYRLAYGGDFLYVFIDVEAEKLICRDRGYQNGDGFVLVLNRPLPENAAADELFMLGYHPTGDPEQPFTQMVWKRNDEWPFSPLSERSLFCVNAEGGRIGFEVLLRWTDVHPYHPWLADGIGFNLMFSKAVGDTEVNFLAASLKPAPGDEAFDAYSRLDFAPPVLTSGVRSMALVESGHITSGDPLPVKIAAASALAVREEVLFTIRSGEGTRIFSQAVGVDLAPGVSVRETVLDTSELAAGGYLVHWESRLGPASGQTGLTVLPSFDAAAKEKDCVEAGRRISPGSLQTIRFLLADIAGERSRLKAYDTCPGLRAKMERADLLLRAAADGDDRLARQEGFLRRAFESQVDNTLQPYTVYVPKGLEAGKKYPALVFLHGSDSDDQSVKRTVRAFPSLFPERAFVIAPYGRGPSNSYTRDHAQEDIHEAVADALRHYPIDPGRLVLTVFSMGGYGVYRTLYENPKMYTAAAAFSGIPFAESQYAPGGGNPDFRKPEFLKPLSGMNIAVIHGGRDRNCPVEITADLVALMKRSGIPVLFLLDREAGHEPPRDPAVIAEYRRWLEAAVKEK